MDYRSLIAKLGQKVQLSADIYPLPDCEFYYKWEVTRGKDIASVDDKGVLTISPKAIPGDTFTVKTTAVLKDPYIKPKASIVSYLVQ
jgi:hypothetical protein